ncbi:MAG: DinB family protein [Thermoanaerobaculia bacterium]
MKRLIGSTAVLALLLALALPVLAQDKAAAKPAASGTKADILRSVGDAEKKLIALAEAMPADKYTWHPEGARTVGEVFAHVSAANYFFPTFWGNKIPASVDPRNFEKEGADKAKTVDHLKKSFEYVKHAIEEVPEADLGKMTKILDHEGTYREALLIVVSHAHEHLGQSIAYARSNGVVPPWSKKGD